MKYHDMNSHKKILSFPSWFACNILRWKMKELSQQRKQLSPRKISFYYSKPKFVTTDKQMFLFTSLVLGTIIHKQLVVYQQMENSLKYTNFNKFYATAYDNKCIDRSNYSIVGGFEISCCQSTVVTSGITVAWI